MPAEHQLELWLGAQVMLIKNVNEYLVNGVMGTVIGFYHHWEVISAPTDVASDLDNQHVNGNYIRDVSLALDGWLAVLVDILPDNCIVDNARYPLVLFQYIGPNSETTNTDIKAVLVKWEEFHVEDLEGGVLTCWVQLYVSFIVSLWFWLSYQTFDSCLSYVYPQEPRPNDSSGQSRPYQGIWER